MIGDLERKPQFMPRLSPKLLPGSSLKLEMYQSVARAQIPICLSFNPVKCVRARDIAAGYHTLIFEGTISFPYRVNSAIIHDNS